MAVATPLNEKGNCMVEIVSNDEYELVNGLKRVKN